jgi:hypothetical protein
MKINDMIKIVELLRKERSIYAEISKSEYEEKCLDTVISMLDDEIEELTE